MSTVDNESEAQQRNAACHCCFCCCAGLMVLWEARGERSVSICLLEGRL